MMKKMMVLALASGLLAISCQRNNTTTLCTNADPATEDVAIRNYIASKGYTAPKDSARGIYYQILTPGTGAQATATSTVTVAYTGRLLNDVGFDSSATGVQLYMGSVITGWQRAIPLLRAGGSMRLVIPSAYAYGCRPQGSTIPANSPLYFDIRLIQVN